jgi:hypothetical protein
MPKWSPSQNQELKSSLNEVLRDLGTELEGLPDFEKVAGVSMLEMTKHAASACGMYAETHDLKLASSQMMDLCQVYTLGFVVGSRFGARRERESHDDQTMRE